MTNEKSGKRDLVKVSTYAAERGISVSMVYKMIHQGKVELVEIDGVKFIRRSVGNNEEKKGARL